MKRPQIRNSIGEPCDGFPKHSRLIELCPGPPDCVCAEMVSLSWITGIQPGRRKPWEREYVTELLAFLYSRGFTLDKPDGEKPGNEYVWLSKP